MEQLTREDVKKIIANKDNAIDFLLYMNIDISYKDLIKLKSEPIYDLLMDNIDYGTFHIYIRLHSMKSKYSNDNFLKYQNSYIECSKLLNENYTDRTWSFNPSSYEDEQIKVIRKYDSIQDSLNEHLKKCEKNLIIKSYNNSRAFLFEYFLVRNNDKILPTLSNSKGVDIYIDKKWDLKNTSGVTKQFKDFYGENWKDFAYKNPKIVAEFLYKNQGEERFDTNDRIFIIDLAETIKPVSEIEKICKNLNFNDVHVINFEKEINGVKNNYTANAMVVFL